MFCFQFRSSITNWENADQGYLHLAIIYDNTGPCSKRCCNRPLSIISDDTGPWSKRWCNWITNTKFGLTPFHLMNREISAYYTPAAIILGIATHNCLSSIYIIYKKAVTPGCLWIWSVSSVALLFIASFITFQTIRLDLISNSAYDLSQNWPRIIQIGNYACNALATIGISAVLIMLLSVFHKVFIHLI